MKKFYRDTFIPLRISEEECLGWEIRKDGVTTQLRDALAKKGLRISMLAKRDVVSIGNN